MKVLFINSKPDLSFFTKRGLVIDATYETSGKKFTTIPVGTAINSNNQIIQLYSPDVYEYLNTTYKDTKYDIIIWGWYPKDYGTEFNGTGGKTFRQKLNNGAYFITARQDGGNYEPHEIMHAIGQILYIDLKKYDAVDQMDAIVKNDGTVLRYYKDDKPEDPDSNFSVTWETYKKYLPELNNLNKMPTYKYFKPNEITGLKPELVQKLDEARGLAGVPFPIGSGLRTPDKNAAVGGVENSAHLTGEAADIRCTDSVKRLKMLKAFLQVGFTRIGIGKDFIHVDISKTLPQNVIWTYYQ